MFNLKPLYLEPYDILNYELIFPLFLPSPFIHMISVFNGQPLIKYCIMLILTLTVEVWFQHSKENGKCPLTLKLKVKLN